MAVFKHTPGHPCCVAGSSGSSGSTGSTGSTGTGSTGSTGTGSGSTGSGWPPPPEGDPLEVDCCPGLLLPRRLRLDWFVTYELVTVASGTSPLDYDETRGGWYWRQKVEPGACDWDLRLLFYTVLPPDELHGCYGCVSHIAAGANDDVTVAAILAGGSAEHCSDSGGMFPASFGVVSCDPFLARSVPTFGPGQISPKCGPFFNSIIYLEATEL